LEAVERYRRKNMDKARDKWTRHYQRLKGDDEKMKAFQEKKRQYYINVKKPRIEAAKAAKAAKLKTQED
jgi:hypothetical protein